MILCCDMEHIKAALTPTGWQQYKTFSFNTLRPRQDGCHFPDDIFKCIFLSENVWISIKISLKFVLKGPINNIPALVQIMAWRHPGDKPLSELIMVSLPMHLCITRPQWVNVRIHNKGISVPCYWYSAVWRLHDSKIQDSKIQASFISQKYKYS